LSENKPTILVGPVGRLGVFHLLLNMMSSSSSMKAEV
jgi:hypothetical protein